MSAGTVRRYSRGALALAWLALVGIEILTQLSLKAAGRKTGRFDFSLHAFQSALGCGWLWVGIASYCAGFFTWMFILARLGSFPRLSDQRDRLRRGDAGLLAGA